MRRLITIGSIDILKKKRKFKIRLTLFIQLSLAPIKHLNKGRFTIRQIERMFDQCYTTIQFTFFFIYFHQEISEYFSRRKAGTHSNERFPVPSSKLTNRFLFFFFSFFLFFLKSIAILRKKRKTVE